MPACSSSPVLDVLVRHAPGVGAPVEAAKELLAALAAVPDPRAARGVRHRIGPILAVGVCAVLAGARSFVAIAEWAADLPPGVRLRLGLGRRTASESTIRRVLQRVDPDALDATLSRWLVARASPPGHGPRVIAIDGKTVRGARTETGQVHLLAAFEVTNGVVLGQVQVDGKSNEITAFCPLLQGIEIAGALITADAMHTQRGHADYLHERGAHYLLTVKANQPNLHNALRALPWKDVPVAGQSREVGHGRAETRTLKVVAVAAGISFPNAALALRMTRRRRVGTGRWTVETIYAITDLSWHQINPAEIAEAMRRHWDIENRLHWIRDVTFAEDHSQVRTGHGPAVMATFRNFAISRHRLGGATNIAAACRHVARHPARAVQLIA